MSELEKDFTIGEVAEAIGMSPRWIRDRISDGEHGRGPEVEHIRYGHKIRFTPEQVEKLRAAHTKAPASASMTTGRKRRSA